MADLHSLIRLHKHELDEKRRALAELYAAMAALERQRRDLENAFEREKEAMAAAAEVQFTFASYAQEVARRREEIAKAEDDMQRRIDKAKDAMMETFAELKKYEMTQEERDRIEEEERAFREAKELDAIGIEGFRRKEKDQG